MKLLLSNRNLILAIGDSIEYGVWGNLGEAYSWRLSANRFAVDDNYSVVAVNDEDIPLYVYEGGYYYIDGEFKLADECPNEYRDRIVTLEENAVIAADDLLNTQLALTEQYEANLVIEEDLLNTQLALTEQYESNLALEEELTNTQLALIEQYESNLIIEEELTAAKEELDIARNEITDLQLAICELYESMI